ncbi:phosphatidic acid phosphatase type 2/haloperoxidase [Geranomyces variabilis]|nr:phosphatidic acid phosphatase type 2/haloperoxidase [Geranomyces variabilis]
MAPPDRVHILYQTRSNNIFHLLRESWLEWLAIIVLLVASGLLEFVQPFERVAFGVDWQIAYPMSTQTVPTWLLAVLAVGVPLLGIVLISLLFKRSVFDFHQSFLGLCVALSFTLLFTQIVKVSTGGLRPDFLDRCKPIYATNDPLMRVLSCTGNASDIKEGRKSFFSGHSSIGWAGLGFLSLYLSRHLNFYRKPLAPKYAITIIPIIVALLISISRVDNFWHHWQDVVVGAIVGAIVAVLSYRSHCAHLEEFADDGGSGVGVPGQPGLPHHHPISRQPTGAQFTDFLVSGTSRRSSHYDSSDSLRPQNIENSRREDSRNNSHLVDVPLEGRAQQGQPRVG